MIRGLRRLSLFVPCYAKQPLVQVEYSMTWAGRAWDLHDGPWDPSPGTWAHDGAVASLPSSKRRGTEMQGISAGTSLTPGLCWRDTCPLAMDVLSSRTMGTRRIDGPFRVHREPLALLTHLHNPFGTEAGPLRLFPSHVLASKLLLIIGQFQAWVLKLSLFSLLWLHGDYAELKGTLWVALGMPYLIQEKWGRVRAVRIDVSYWGGSGAGGQQWSPAMEMPPCISQAQVPSAAPHTLRCSPPWTPPLCPCARPTTPFIMSFLKSPHQVIQFKITLSVQESSINLCPRLSWPTTQPNQLSKHPFTPMSPPHPSSQLLDLL